MTDDVAEKKIIDYASLDMCMLSYVKIDIDWEKTTYKWM